MKGFKRFFGLGGGIFEDFRSLTTLPAILNDDGGVNRINAFCWPSTRVQRPEVSRESRTGLRHARLRARVRVQVHF